MIAYPNIVGKQEDWANVITNVEMVDTPFLDWLRQDEKLASVEENYQAEQFDAPEENAHVDGKPVTKFKSAGDGRGRLKSYIQYYTKGASVTRLHQDLGNIAGVEDELARDILKRTKEMSRDMEASFLDDGESAEDNGATGYKTRGVGKWIQATAQSHAPVPADFLTPSASIDTTASASLTETIVLDILASMGGVTKSREPITCFTGHKTKRAFNNMPLFTPGSTLLAGTPTGATGVVYTKDLKGRAIDRLMERYNSDYGPVDLVLSWYNAALTGSATVQSLRAYFLHQSRWAMAWGAQGNGGAANGKPTWFRKEYQGGSYEAFCEAIAMLKCLNPKGEGKYAPAS